MPRNPKSFPLYYEHLTLEGKYCVFDDSTRTVKEFTLGHNDILILDRIISFEKNRSHGHAAPLRFYMTNENISDQLRMSYTTASKCISRLKMLGLVKVFFEPAQDGRVEPRRVIYSQPTRIAELVRMRADTPEGLLVINPPENGGQNDNTPLH